MSFLPDVTLEAVLDRAASVFTPTLRPNHLLLGTTGAGKTMLARMLMERCAYADRTVILDPKTHDDPSWTGDDELIGPAPRPVTTLASGFGTRGDGGGPSRTWLRLVADRDPQVTADRFRDGLRLIGREGHCLVVLDDARTLHKSHGLTDAIEDTVFLGRSGGQSCMVCTQELGYLSVRAQTAFKWIGHVGSRQAAKAAVNLLGQRGAAWEDEILSLQPGEWVYADDAPGSDGPCRFRSWQP